MKNKFFIVLTIALSFTWSSNVFAYDNNKADENCAEALNSLGLFKGNGESFNLDAPLKRSEAAVMVTRLMGAESQAVSKNLSSPFKDVPDWASAYVGWLYQNKLIYGIDSTTYGSEQNISGEEYMTILLRCLGYSDAEGGDFKFSEVYDFADKVFDSLTMNELRSPENNFVRYDCTYLTVKSLFCGMKGGGELLSDHLISENAFTKDEYAESVNTLLGTTFYDSHKINEDGYIIPYFEEMPISNLDRSEIKFESIEFSTYDNLIAKSLDGKNYMIDKNSLTVITEMTDEEIEFTNYVDETITELNSTYQSPDGVTYYVKEIGKPYYGDAIFTSYSNIGSESDRGGSITVKSIDSEGVSADIVRFNLYYYYSSEEETAGGTMFSIIGRRGSVVEYVHIDVVSGKITTIPIENAEYVDIIVTEEKTLIMSSDGETKNIYLIKDGKLLDSIKSKTSIKTAHISFHGEASTVADYEDFYLIEDDKFSVLADFDMFVNSALKNYQGYYIVRSHMSYHDSDYGSFYRADQLELGLLDYQGNYSVVMPIEIVPDSYYSYLDLSSIDDNGNLIFYQYMELGALTDYFTYSYNVETKKITVTDFYARADRSEKYKNEMMTTEQARVDELHN